MDGFFALIVTVNNQVKRIAVFAFQRNELFSRLGAGANIIDQRQVAVRCQRIAAARHAADAHGAVGGVGDGQIAAVHIAHTGR